MKPLRRCLHELGALFVDDGITAVVMVGWIFLACLGLRRMSVGIWSGPMLFVGLAVIFTVGTLPRRR